MRAIAITPGKPGAHLVERPEPEITAPDQIKLQVVQVGICGTDREEIIGGRADAPAGASELVIGHEMLGKVAGVGSAVKRVKAGDYAVFTVRRGCGECADCGMGRFDMCQTGKYRERGIKQLDGYQTEYVVDREEFVVGVLPDLSKVAVLMEPLSIVEKAIDESIHIQRRRFPAAAVTPDWLVGRACLVAGLGPVGLLAAMALRLRGAEVYGLDIVDAASARPRWLESIGGRYLDGRAVAASQISAKAGAMDLVLDASGVAKLQWNLLDALAWNGIYTVTGIPGSDQPLSIPGAQLLRRLVLGNQVMFGSVNAARGHFQMAADDLAQAHLRWPGKVAQLITDRRTPEEFVQAPTAHSQGVIKEIVAWAE